jgi:hypothetical protein
MKKAFPKIALGSIIIIAGIIIGYIYLAGAHEGQSFLFLALSLGLIAGGLFILGRVGETVYNLDTQTEEESHAEKKQGFESMLEKNNAMVEDYANTAKTRDQLKILEIAGAAEEQASK